MWGPLPRDLLLLAVRPMLTGPFDFLPLLLSLSLLLPLVLNCRIGDIVSTVDDNDSIIVDDEDPPAAVAADR